MFYTPDAVNEYTNAGLYSYGNYYNWPAAMANTIYYTNQTNTDEDGKTSETVATSICPKGWRLPRGGYKSREATNDFWALIVNSINGGVKPANYDSSYQPSYSGTTEGANASNKLRAFPNNFIYSGSFAESSTNARGSVGVYWSSTSQDNTSTYTLRFARTSVQPGNSTSMKYTGDCIRCMVSISD